MATPYNGQLRQNEVYSSIYNMIISQQVFSDPIRNTYDKLAKLFKTDGSMYGDTKLFYSVQVTDVEDWRGDAEAANLLAIKRPADPFCQPVTIDVFKMIWLTIDKFLSKRAWGSESVFSQFNSVILGTIRDTLRVYEASMVDAYVGTTETAVGNQTITVTIPTGTGSTEENNRLAAQTIAEAVANLLVEVKDISTDYNDLEYLRSYDDGDLIFVWNAKAYNKITKLDLPTIFHNNNLVDRLGEYVLPAKYFGTVNTASKTTADANTRSLLPQTIGGTYYYAGQSIPTGTALVDDGEIVVPSYQEDETVILKVVHKDSLKYMSGFQTQTEFMNPRALTNSHYLIFGHSSLAQSRLYEFPWITIKTA